MNCGTRTFAVSASYECFINEAHKRKMPNLINNISSIGGFSRYLIAIACLSEDNF